MNALQIFKQGLKSSLRKPGSIFATILILIVPVMYPLFWLQAFWNPYANIGNLPVAFVNEDSGVYGAGLEQQLRSSVDVKWSFPGRKAADSGLKDKTYYAVFVIPENFSQSISNAQTANIETYVNGKNNFMATLLVSQIEKRLEEQISAQIVQNLTGKLPGGDMVAAFAANPIEGKQIDINPVANTGTGFAPYFSSLALWIGALLISLVLGRRVDKSRLASSDGVNLTLGRFLLFACAGLIQAALLTAIIYALGIDVQSGLLTLAALVVSALTSIALVSTLISIFGMFGQMLSMFLLIFQLTASGGTFPTELTQGGLFMALHPFVPFTYSLNALRETISGVPPDGNVLVRSLAVQLAVLIGALIVCTAVEILRGRGQTKLSGQEMILPQGNS